MAGAECSAMEVIRRVRLWAVIRVDNIAKRLVFGSAVSAAVAAGAHKCVPAHTSIFLGGAPACRWNRCCWWRWRRRRIRWRTGRHNLAVAATLARAAHGAGMKVMCVVVTAPVFVAVVGIAACSVGIDSSVISVLARAIAVACAMEVAGARSERAIVLIDHVAERVFV